MACRADLIGQQHESYVDTGVEKSIEITLSGTPGTLKTITIPDDAKGFRIFPRSSAVRFAVYQSDAARTLAAVAANATGTAAVAASDFAIGGIAKPDLWETRLLPPKLSGVNRTVTLRSITASVVIDMEVF